MKLPPLALGSWHVWDRVPFDDAVAIVRRALDSGVNLLDVGVYGGADGPGSFTDVIVGRIVAASGVRRDAWLLAEKLWLDGWPAEPLAAQLDRALLRVGCDYADLGMVADVPPGTVMEALVGELAELVRVGKLRGWGVCNWRAAEVRAAEALGHAPALAQLKYSVCRRTVVEGEPYGAIFAGGVLLQASDVLEGGILAGKAQPARPIGRDPGGVREEIVAAAPLLRTVAAELGASPARLAIAFCLANPATANVLVGTSSLEQLEDNLGALELLEREGAATIRAAAEGLWVDRGAVSPDEF
jgi:aryl-alcohol dehydrogenase-like predicted oxidoreductase